MAAPLPGKPHLITFDTYGTLIDWDTALRAYVRALFARKGVDLDVSSFYRDWYYGHALPAVTGPFLPYRELLTTTLRTALAAADVPLDADDGHDFGDAMAAARPFPDAAGTLARLARHVPLATISNSQHDIIRESSRLLGDPFTYVFTGEDVRAYKPDAALFELVLEKAGVSPHDAVHVAQSQYVDLPRSVPMGIPTIWINRHGQTLADGTPAPTLEMPDLTQLASVLGFSPDGEQ
ncbi:HAD-IA family hydrolase [Amycolatopsis jejuensis]|uniref:HAD-IA family hydrolase n=1 Tax=Amycolatopsis jejuensis TaxID=330084 RepID=UPI000525EC0F|nr:HAD-IA family hydrolase [Amycolatopsis jejuensis]